MKCSSFCLVVGVALLATGCGGQTDKPETVTSTDATKTDLGPALERVEFGHLKSLTRRGGHYVLRFDPAWLLSGETANKAAAEDGAVNPGEPVPNDNYVVDEGHRLLTHTVPRIAHVTVLTRNGDPARLGATAITVDQLAQIVEGKSTLQLYEPLESGVWIKVAIDTVRAIDQQYEP